jgi:hypothetical protein
MNERIFSGRHLLFASAALAVILTASAAPAVARPQTCPLQGDARQPLAKELNPYKNRENAPPVAKINARATLKAVLAPGKDLNRWGRDDGAIFEGVVVGVKVGGIESVNCHAKDAAHRDTHIELALAPGAPERQRVIVEVTPRWRTKMAVISDWSTAALKKRLTGTRVRIIGWLFDDLEHKAEAENTNPGGAKNWRATIWEIHPITGITVLPDSAMASARASPVAAPAPAPGAAHAAIRKTCASKRNHRCPTRAPPGHAERP